MPLGFGGGVVGGAVVELILQDTAFKTGLTKADAELKTFGRGAGTQMSGFAKVTSGAFLVAGAAAVAFAAVSIKSYMEHQKAVAELQNVIAKMPKLAGENVKAFEDEATALQNLTGYQDEEVLAADAVLGRFQLTGDEIRKLMPLVLDYARATGKDVAQAATDVGKALEGQARALKAVGINFHDTGTRAGNLDAIMQALQDHVEGTAEAFGKTAAGQIAIFKAQLDDLAEAAGKSLLPALTGLLGGLKSLMPVLGLAARNLPLILGVFLGFEVVQFLPGLLLSVAVGFDAVSVGAGSAALAAAGAAESLAAVAGIVAIVSAAVTIGYLKIDQALNNMGVDQKRFTEDLHDWESALQVGAMSAEDFAKEVTTAVDSAFGGQAGNSSAAQFAGILRHDLIPAFLASKITVAEWAQVGYTASKVYGIDLPQAVHDYARAQEDAYTATQLAKIAQRGLNEETKHSTDAIHGFVTATGADWDEFAANAKAAVLGGAESTQKFVDDTIAAFGKWKSALADSLNFVKQSLGGLANKEHLTSADILAEFDKQLKAMSDYGANWDKVAKMGGKGARAFLTSIAEMGAEGAPILAALADGNKADMNRIVGDFNKAGGKATSLSGQIGRTLVGAVKSLKTSIDALIVTMGGIPPRKDTKITANTAPARGDVTTYIGWVNSQYATIDVTARITSTVYGGNPQNQAEGGVIPGYRDGMLVKRPTMFASRAGAFQAGEGKYATPFGPGAESIQPLTPDYFRKVGIGIVEAGGFGGPHDAGAKVELHIHGNVFTMNSREFAENVTPAIAREIAKRQALIRG